VYSGDDIVVGLDFGTTKTCAVVGKINSNGTIDVIGIGSSPSNGIRHGVIVNIDATVEGVKAAVAEAELMSGCKIESVCAGIAGNHIESRNQTGMVGLKGEPVTPKDVENALKAASAINLGPEKEIIHIIPQEFIVDGERGIKDPVGMCCVRLDAKVHVVTGNSTSIQNIVRCVNQCGLAVNDVVLEPIASAESVLNKDEKELGVVLLDIGGGTSDLTIFFGGSLVYSSVTAIGGSHITQDVAIGLRTPGTEAEKLKVKYGCALSRKISRTDMISVPSVGGRQAKQIPRNLLAEIIQQRVEEILSMVSKEIVNTPYAELLSSGIVITGGCSLLEGIDELTEIMFDNIPVRVGYPKGVGGLKTVVNSPIYSTAVGLVLYSSRNRITANKFKNNENTMTNKIRQSVTGFYKELF